MGDLDCVQQNSTADDESGPTAWHSEFTRRRAVQSAFLAVDNQLAAKTAAYTSGSTCTAAAIWHDTIEELRINNKFHVLLANLGDSRGLVVDFSTKHLRGETVDHKPEMDAEYQRISHAGGVVTGNGNLPSRINGDLAV